MQIHELNTFNGTPGGTDFLAIDAGFDTAKISAPKLLEPKLNRPKDNGNYDNGQAGQILRTKGNGLTEWANVGQPTDAQTAQAVSDWLDAHPEATTTVQDGSLTYAKLTKGTLNFVTPEMFGAVGDGITDDTTAIQSAVDYGNAVLFDKKTYCITSSITINSPTTIIGTDSILMQATFAQDKGGLIIKSDNVQILGKFSIVLDDAKSLINVEGTGCSGIHFYSVNPVENFYFEDLTIKGFIGGIVFEGNTISKVMIQKLHVENIDMGIWGAKIHDLHIVELTFNTIDHTQAAADPTHVVYLTGAARSIASANITIDRCVGEYCNAGGEDAVFSIKCTSNFVCHQLICNHVNAVITTLYSSGYVSNVEADDVTYAAFIIQGSSPDNRAFVIKDSNISNISAETMASGSAGAIFEAENISYSGTSDYGVYLSEVIYKETRCKYENTGNSLSMYAYRLNETNTAHNLIIEPTLVNSYLAKYVQDKTKTRFVLNPRYYDGAELSAGGGVSLYEFVPNNVFRTTAGYAYSEWFNNNLIVTGQSVTQLRGEGLHIIKNGASVAIMNNAKIVLKGGTDLAGSAWQIIWFYVYNTVAYEIAHI